MNEFVQRILTELKANESICSEPLVKMLVESTEKSIALGENINSIYTKLKEGLFVISENTSNQHLGAVVSQFNKNEETLDSKVLKIAKAANLSEKISIIKESNAYSNPVVKTQVDAFEASLNSGAPDFALCSRFIESFEQYQYDSTIASEVSKVKSYIFENASTLAMLNTIYQLEMMKTPLYAGVNNNLKTLLVSESYSADILKMTYSNTVPVITSLINDLALIESNTTGAFTLGEGNYDTKINNLITPVIKIEEGILMYTDNRFLSIRESNGLLGFESKIHINDSFKIADLSPEYVKQKYQSFYELCEAYASLSFEKTQDGLGVESNRIRNFKLGFKVNEAKNLDLYVNGVKMGEPGSANISEALALEVNITKNRVNKIIEGASSLCNLEFIKEMSNDRLMTECTVFSLNDSYVICEKVNSADRLWHTMNEQEMYEFFKTKFNYDISSIYKIQIDEISAQLKKIEETKLTISENVAKLEQSVLKLNEAIANNGLDTAQLKKLQGIKDAIEGSIKNLKEEYIRVDLLKKKQIA